VAGPEPDQQFPFDRDLLEAYVSIVSGVELESVLSRVVSSAMQMTGATYGALGVVGTAPGAERLSRFIPVGLSEAEIAGIDHWPRGEGILGLLIDEPRSLRLPDIAVHPRSSGFPAGHPPMTTFLGVPVQVHGTVYGNLYLTDKSGGGEFSADDEAVVTALSALAGAAIESAHQYEQSNRRGQWLEAISEVSSRLLSGEDTSAVLGFVAETARDLADADLSAVLLPGPDPQEYVLRAVFGDRATGLEGSTVHVPEGESASSAETALAEHFGIPQVLMAELGQEDRRRGLVAVARYAHRPRPSAELRLALQAFANQAGVALELAESRAQSERLVVLEDRDRIARDLHDVVIQQLFASAMTLMSASKLIAEPAAATRVRQAVDDLDDTIRQIRSTIFALQADDPDAPSLRRRVLRTSEAVAAYSTLKPEVEFNGPVDTTISAEVADHVLAVIGEALSNAVRHSHASSVRVAVHADEYVTVEVTDDGVGITDTGRRSGLANLEARAASLGGTFDVRRGASSGSVLRWSVPVS